MIYVSAMEGDRHAFFSNSIKGKILIACVVACLTLLSAWAVTRIAFKRVLNAVEKISAPNDKLRLVNELTHRVAQMDQAPKAELLGNPAGYNVFFSETKKQLLVTDTLQTLYADDPQQAKRIRSIKKLLLAHDQLFISYLKVREGLVNNKAFSGQVKLLNDLVIKSALQNDSAAITTEKRVHTTIITPANNNDSARDKRGFISKLFGKKKSPAPHVSYNVVNVELHTHHDSVAIARQDSIFKGMGRTMRRLENGQLQRSAMFVDKEAVLSRTDNRLIRKVLFLLKQVEAEAMIQNALNNNMAKSVVGISVTRISYIVLTFFLITVVLLYFILRDLARGEQHREALESARDEAEYHAQAKQRFLSNMSHEIRTPLQSIIGYTELMRRHGHSGKNDIEAIHRSSEHLMQIVNEVLDYNRIISGKFVIAGEVFNMAMVINDVLSALRLQTEKKGIKLVSELATNVDTYVRGDPFRLKQILYNLLGNAIKFTAAGEVKLTVRSAENGESSAYAFTISDTGAGLSERDIGRIFNEFEQVQENPNRLKGTGLGLTISKALIEAQGGSISVSSTLGKGSDFMFFLNYEAVSEPDKDHDKPDGTEDRSYGTVWLIDDDQFILELCRALFDVHGIKNRCFTSPSEILTAAPDPELKCILLDIRMPEMSGIELCTLLRQRVAAEVKIYALTAQVLPGELGAVLGKDFDGLLMKPFKEEELLRLLSPGAAGGDRVLEIELDLTSVKKMTFGDQKQLHKILKRFTEDCIADIAELRSALDKNDHERCALVVHRVAGRTAQIGAAELAADLRKMEMDLVKDKVIYADGVNAVLILIGRLQVLVKQIIVNYPDII